MCWPCKSWYRLTSDQSGDLETDDLTWPRSTSALLYYHRSPSPIRSGHAKTVHRWPVNTAIVSVYIILRGTEVEPSMWWWTIIFLDHSEQMLVCSVFTLKSPGAKLVYIVVLCCVRNSSYWPSMITTWPSCINSLVINWRCINFPVTNRYLPFQCRVVNTALVDKTQSHKHTDIITKK